MLVAYYFVLLILMDCSVVALHCFYGTGSWSCDCLIAILLFGLERLFSLYVVSLLVEINNRLGSCAIIIGASILD